MMDSNISMAKFVKCSPTASEEAFLQSHAERQQQALRASLLFEVPPSLPHVAAAKSQQTSIVGAMDPTSAYMIAAHDRDTTRPSSNDKPARSSITESNYKKRFSFIRSTSEQEVFKSKISNPIHMPTSPLARQDSMFDPKVRLPNDSVHSEFTIEKKRIDPAAAIAINSKILEQVLANVECPLDLLRCLKVNRVWRNSILVSTKLRRIMFMAPASSSKHRLNPLLTMLGTISYLHPAYDILISDGINPRKNGLILGYKGNFYRPECFFGYASNPSLQTDLYGQRYLQWELRKLTRLEVIKLNERVEHITTQASLWKMYLCQPPVSEVHVTIWRKEEIADDIFRGPQGIVLARATVKAWSVQAIFEALEEAATRPSIASVQQNTSVRSLKSKASSVFEKASAKALVNKVKSSMKKDGTAFGTALASGYVGVESPAQKIGGTVFKMVP